MIIVVLPIPDGFCACRVLSTNIGTGVSARNARSRGKGISLIIRKRTGGEADSVRCVGLLTPRTSIDICDRRGVRAPDCVVLRGSLPVQGRRVTFDMAVVVVIPDGRSTAICIRTELCAGGIRIDRRPRG